MENNDWRIRWQEDYLKNRTFYLHPYIAWSKRWDHEHCEFCWKKIEANSDREEWYSTIDDYYWVCKECFNDYKERLSFRKWNENDFINEKLLDILKHEIGFFQGKYDFFELRRVINILYKLIDIKKVSSLLVKPLIVRISSNRKLEPSVKSLEDEKRTLLNVSNEELLIELNKINKELQVNNEPSTIFVNIKEILNKDVIKCD
ncbi:MAG: hypothetical protein VB086_04300 [Clostridiaceae bacterium]|nr:hypothetical protein [Clostridiaceae bacterium]